MKIVSNLSVDDFDGEKENLKGYLSLLHGTIPTYETFITPEEEDKYILNTLKDYLEGGDIQPNEICLSSRTNSGLDELKKILSSAGIKYLDISSYKQNINAVNVSTFHNMKGHEFKIVFVKGMSESTVPFKYSNYTNLTEKELEVYNQQERSLYYVVFSRAIQKLIITGVGEKSKWVAI